MPDTTGMPEAEITHATTDEAGHGHGHDSDHDGAHAPAGEPLGPVDLGAWAYTLGGSMLGLLTVLALYIARGV